MIKQITEIDSVFEGFGNPVKLMSYYNILKEEDNVKEYKLLRNAINKKVQLKILKKLINVLIK